MNSVKQKFPLFLDKTGALSYTSPAVTPQCPSIPGAGGMSVPLDNPGAGRIAVPLMNPPASHSPRLAGVSEKKWGGLFLVRMKALRNLLRIAFNNGYLRVIKETVHGKD